VADPWLTIIGINENGLAGLSQSSRHAIASAEVIYGGARHLALAEADGRGKVWAVPFDLAPLLSGRGKPTVMLASGDPFWFGAGGSIAAHLDRSEWIAHPAPSTFALAACRLGWRLEDVLCLGLHAAPFERLVPLLHQDAQIICLVRDGAAAVALAQWLVDHGWGQSQIWSLSALGGPREVIKHATAATVSETAMAAPIAVAIKAVGCSGLPRISGLADDLFKNDGQLTKRPVRALALSALAPRPGERLWDIGAGCGSITIEWALAGGHAIAIEPRADRMANIQMNCDAFGIEHRVQCVHATAPDGLAGLAHPDAVFVGGGLSAALINDLSTRLRAGTRIVAHAVTLETEATLADLQSRYGGELMRFEIAQAEPLGRMRSWKASRPITQWSGAL